MTAEEEEYVFSHEIGAALLEWARVETALERVVACCSDDMATSERMAVGFRSIENFRSKLAYADAMVTHAKALRPAVMDRWKSLQERVVSLSSRRNELAHSEAQRLPQGESGKRFALLKGGWHLRPTGGSASIADLDKIFLLDIVERRENFAALRCAIENFCSFVRGLQGPHPASAEQPARRRTIRYIEDRMRVAVGRQPRPSREKPSPSENS